MELTNAVMSEFWPNEWKSEIKPKDVAAAAVAASLIQFVFLICDLNGAMEIILHAMNLI